MSERNLRVLAIDPGKVTGKATWIEGCSAPASVEVEGGLTGMVGISVRTEIELADAVFIEDWMVRPNTHRLTPEPDAYLILGYVQGVCAEVGTPLYKIGPSEHKTFTKVGKASSLIRKLGWAPVTEDNHAEDAASVLLVGLARHFRHLVTDELANLAEHI